MKREFGELAIQLTFSSFFFADAGDRRKWINSYYTPVITVVTVIIFHYSPVEGTIVCT